MKRNITILVADYEKKTLMSLKELIHNEFQDIDVILARNGESAWENIQNYKPDILIADIDMPAQEGISLLKKIKEFSTLNEIFIIIISSKPAEKIRADLLENGADEYLNKNSDKVEIAARIRTAIKIKQLQNKINEENRILQDLAKDLESDIQDLTMLAVKFMEARVPASMDTLKKIAKASVWIAIEYENYNEQTIRDIEIASFLSMAGRIFLPDYLINEPVMKDGKVTNPIMNQVPFSGKEIISSINRFENVSKFIYHVYENFDGTGIPSQLQSWQIPFPSRIIRAVSDYYELKLVTDKSPEEILQKLKIQAKRLYDHRVVALLEHYVRSISKEIENKNEIAVKITDLRPNMILTRDVMTDAGLKLIPAGAVLSEKSIKMIFNHNSTDPILGGLFIKKH
jgi:response regulator RpfG family c-di-GMP phosphodiesterase